MSYPTITFEQQWTHDCDSTTGWTKDAAPTLTATLSVVNGDYFNINATVGSGSVYWEYDIVPPLSNWASYDHYIIRVKTNGATKAKVTNIFTTCAEEVTVLAESTYTTFTVATGTLTKCSHGTHVVDKVRIYATTGAGNVWFDFIRYHDDTFTFPNADVKLLLPAPVIAKIQVPGRDGEVLQNMGSEYARVHITANMNDATGWGTPVGQRIYQIAHKMTSSLWEWLTLPYDSTSKTGLGCKFKVTLDGPPEINLEGGKMTLSLWLKEYKLGDADTTETYTERFGH